MERPPLEVQTLSAILLDCLPAAETHRTLGSTPGSLVSKEIKGEHDLTPFLQLFACKT
jgi:hypothetical protein